MAKKAYHHGNLHAALVAAGLREVAKSGPDGFSLREVARRAGVSAPAVYRHFADKDALLVAIAAECGERLLHALTTAAAAGPADDPLARFRMVGIAYVRFAVEHPEHFRAMTVPGVLALQPATQLAASLRWQADLRASVAGGQARGNIAALPIDDVMMSATSIVHGLAHYIVEGYYGDIELDRALELASAVTHVLAHGLEPRTHAPKSQLQSQRQ